MKKFLCSLMACASFGFALGQCPEGATTIAQENFDNGNWNNNIESLLFVDPTSPNEGLFIFETTGNNPNFSGNIVHAQDLTGEPGEPSLEPYVFTFDEVNVSNYKDIHFSFDYYVKTKNDTGKYILIVDGVEKEVVWFDGVTKSGQVNELIGEATTVALRFEGELNGSKDLFEIDNIQLCGVAKEDVTPATCEAPTDLSVDNVSTDYANFRWSYEGEAQDFEVIVVKKGQAMSEGQSLSSYGDYNIPLSNLVPSTTYTAYVRTLCTSTTMSEWVSIDFTTEDAPSQGDVACAEGAVVITHENFDNGNWNNNIESLLFVDPNSSDQGLFIFETTGNNPNFSGNIVHAQDLAGETGEPSLDPYVFTFDEVNVSNYKDIRFSFDYYVRNNDTGKYILIVDGVEKEVVWFNNETKAGQVNEFIGEATTVALRFEGKLNGGDDLFEIDNIQLCGVEKPITEPCDAPVNVSVSNITATSAQVAWDNNTAASTYDLVIVKEGMEVFTGENISVNTINYIFNDLEPNTTYDVYVRTVCSPNQFSEWTKTSFTTQEETAPGVCLEPTGVVITRLSGTTATFTADDKNAVYQGTANLEGRPLRPYPMYGMTNMTLPYTQTNLVPAYAYWVWLRTKCDNDTYSEWVGPYTLPVYEGGKSQVEGANVNVKKATLYPNPAIGNIIKVNGVDGKSIEVYDMSGIKLMNLPVDKEEIDIRRLPTGKYNLRITDKEGNVYFKNLIKK